MSPISSLPTVRDVLSIVTLTVDVILSVLKLAKPPLSATPPGGTDVQFAVLLQLPFPLRVQVPSGSITGPGVGEGVGDGLGLPPAPQPRPEFVFVELEDVTCTTWALTSPGTLARRNAARIAASDQ